MCCIHNLPTQTFIMRMVNYFLLSFLSMLSVGFLWKEMSPRCSFIVLCNIISISYFFCVKLENWLFDQNLHLQHSFLFILKAKYLCPTIITAFLVSMDPNEGLIPIFEWSRKTPIYRRNNDNDRP